MEERIEIEVAISLDWSACKGDGGKTISVQMWRAKTLAGTVEDKTAAVGKEYGWRSPVPAGESFEILNWNRENRR